MTDAKATKPPQGSPSRPDSPTQSSAPTQPSSPGQPGSLVQPVLPPLILVVMGVSGCGKSTIAEKIAASLHWPMVEGDDLHPPANIAKMKQHQPLNDTDRQPWLTAIGRRIDAWRGENSAGIITCSALKRRYRDQLVAGRPNLWFIYLKGSKELIQERLAQRKGHFMPPDMLDSQLADLEEPTADEPAIIADIAPSPDEIAKNIIAALQGKLSHA